MTGRKNRLAAILQLVTALDIGSLYKSRYVLTGERIPIKCIFLRYLDENPLGWSGVDQLLSELPPTVENFLCYNKHISRGQSAYVIQRGLHGQITRKELWNGPKCYLSAHHWFVPQTSHIIPYDPSDLRYMEFTQVELLSEVIYSNCTIRRGGLPSDGAIPTGGQLVRMAYLYWCPGFLLPQRQLVWSSQTFLEGEYDEVWMTPLYGPKP
ncbi:hypothetical protein BDV93DRAFT_525176 [Ceratobasidium sp. AG-I]|nr:hypothetical protein BDV93DRAFT_525176 [Ceratobasidium sp. AG-I]